MADEWDDQCRAAWRVGFAPFLPAKGLEALAAALRDDDPRLIQGATTDPPPLQFVEGWPAEAACAVGFCFWQAADDPATVTVGQVEAAFGEACFRADEALDTPAGCRFFLHPFDSLPRDEVRRELLAEVEAELARRGGVAK